MFDKLVSRKIREFKSHLLKYNEHTNIYSKKSYHLLDMHIQDSLNLAELTSGTLCHVDMGSGSGLPGVIMAIASSASIICIESKEKKRGFLEHVKIALDLKNLTVFKGDVQSFARCYSGRRITSFSAKAFVKPPKLLSYLSMFGRGQYLSSAYCWVPISERQAGILSSFDEVVSIQGQDGQILFYFKIGMGSYRSYKADLKKQYNL